MTRILTTVKDVVRLRKEYDDALKSDSRVEKDNALEKILTAGIRAGFNRAELSILTGLDRLELDRKVKKFGIGIKELCQEKDKYLKDEIEKSLTMAATGFYSEDYEEIYDENDMLVKRKITRKFNPPNHSANMFWLKNKYPEEYRDKTDVNHNISLPEALRNTKIKIEIVGGGSED